MQPIEAKPCPRGHRAEFRYREPNGALRCRLCRRDYENRADVKARRARRRKQREAARYRLQWSALIDSGRLSRAQLDALERRGVLDPDLAIF